MTSREANVQRRRRAAIASVVITGITLILIYVGSQGFETFDSALIGYAVATVFAIAALTYRYTLWLGRSPTWRYFRAGWTEFLSWRNFRRYTLLIPRAWWTDIFAQTFIFRRSPIRWLMHQAIFWGVLVSLFLTIPLTFGWIRFTLVGTDHYQAWFFWLPCHDLPDRGGHRFRGLPYPRFHRDPAVDRDRHRALAARQRCWPALHSTIRLRPGAARAALRHRDHGLGTDRLL